MNVQARVAWWTMDEITTVMDDAAAMAQTPEPPGHSASTPAVTPETLAPAIEAILLTLDRPVPLRRLAEGLGLVKPEAKPDAKTPAKPAPELGDASEPAEPAPKPSRRRSTKADASDPLAPVQQAIDLLNQQYEQTGRAFRIEAVAGGYRLMTMPQFAGVLATFHQTRLSARLSKPAIETLAVIAYQQPITRAHLEAIRGVNCGEVLRSLVERRLVTITGRAEELGRPILYGTTKEFLDAFGLASLKDLPAAGDLGVAP